MLKGLTKDLKIYNFSQATNKGKKTNIPFSDKGSYRRKEKALNCDKIYCPTGEYISGKLSRKILVKSNENQEVMSCSPSKKIFKEKFINTKRTILPELQEKKVNESCYSKYINKISKLKFFKSTTDMLNSSLKVRFKEENPRGRKLGDEKHYKSFEFNENVTDYCSVSPQKM